MNAHVSKPIVLEQLEKTIKDVLEGLEQGGGKTAPETSYDENSIE